ncbi:siderophore-interacting protein [Nitrogeniibacter mangrovi]|uniref:Siderophore-interacting protein n=2 Tax=Nitrogeniibacter mangrovi TaxID=2016596 RepID=A0A6C1B7P2_9RHOO|nr:siderophore-interacting protein [Nitrogeniibacter mangrovi]
MLRGLFAVLVVLAGWTTPVVAQGSDDALGWLERMAGAARQLNYVGTFTYLSDQRFETMRIAHALRGDGEVERLETLDGSPREVIRKNGEVRCVLPGLKTVIIDRQGRRRAFPGRLPVSVGQLGEHYRFVKGAEGRVAGRMSQSVRLEPLDNLRFGHELWADLETGLLLKARVLDEKGKVVEQFVFNDVHIGGDVDAAQLQGQYDAGSDWHVVNARGNEAEVASVHWTLSEVVPGYRLVSTVRRAVTGESNDVLHMVYSDGLAHISVFIEPASKGDEQAPATGFLTAGSIGVYARNYAGYRLTVLGEAPKEALRRVGDGMEYQGD